MKTQLESRPFTPSHATWSISVRASFRRLPALRPIRRPVCDASSICPLPAAVFSQQCLHTTLSLSTSMSFCEAGPGVIVGAPRRPRCAAGPRFFAPPRTHTAPSKARSEEKGVATSTSPSTTCAALVSSRLRRSHILAACPLLYFAASSSSVSEALALRGRGVLPYAEKQIAYLANDVCSVSQFGASGAACTEEAAWSGVTMPFVALLCHALSRRSVFLSEAVFVRCLAQITAKTDCEMSNAVAVLVRSLLAQWSTQPARPSSTHVESTVRSVLESTSDVLLHVVIAALQVQPHPFSAALPDGINRAMATVPQPLTEAPLRCGSLAADDLHGTRRWHTCLSEAVVKVCLQRTAHVLAGGGERRKANDAVALSPVLRHRLQRCCLCQLPPLHDDRTRHDCAVLTMGALKGAAYPVLVAAYSYFAEEGLASVPVALRFLANCGICVPHVMQHGVSLSVYVAATAAVTQLPTTAARSFRAPRATLEPLLHARTTLLESGRELRQIEGGLLHVNAVLNALGYAADVRAFYARGLPRHDSALSELRETPHSVMALVRLRSVEGSVSALAELGASRPEGWVSMPPAVVQCMEAVSRLVGVVGTPAQVDALYAALVGFHNGALFMSHYVELVLAGVCDRIRDLRSAEKSQLPRRDRPNAAASSDRATPHEVLQHIIPVVRATLRYVGDELNADMILELVETALHVDTYAVSLTAALVWAFRAWMELSLCLQELLCRVDASTHNVPFLHFYALCYARDFCTSATFDHLAALWHVDGDAIWNRAAHLSPSCQLWKCASCGRLNSDRYNYCLCSSLRYSHVLCATCGYAQDERLRQCRSCGAALLSKAALSGAVARKAWQCGDCGARNPAKQTLLCFRCGQATGPRIREAHSMEGSRTVAQQSSFCACHGDSDAHATDNTSRQQRSAAAYTAAVGVCRTCGHFKMDYAAHHSTVWSCVGCNQRRSTLERICPSCPQVECLPHAVSRESIEQPRVCRHCQQDELNPFTVVCSSCGCSDDPFRSCAPSPAATATSPSPSLSSAGVSDHHPTSTAFGTSDAADAEGQTSRALHWCFHCHHAQAWTDESSLPHACCESCGAPCERRGQCALPPRLCGQCGAALPSEYSGSAVCAHCAAYVKPAAQPTSSHTTPSMSTSGGAVVWNAVTVLHTCEVLDMCCAREAPLAHGASSDLVSIPAASDAHGTLLRQRPTLEKTLARFVREWTDPNDEALNVAAWLALRMDVATVLGRTLNRLRQHIPYSLTARRLSALLKGILAHVDSLCGTAASGSRGNIVGPHNTHTHFTLEERCHHCLGTHPEELCPFQEDDGCWACTECGFANDNDDVGRYVCAGCLALRPVVQELLVSTCWVCHGCRRANVQFERYCVHCGLERDRWSAELLLPCTVADEKAGVGRDEEGKEAPMSTLLSSTFRDDEIPFAPAKCHLCGLVYIEARCPLCENHIPDVADAKGVVCEVRRRHAFIQPVGTTRVQDRIYVDETLLHSVPLCEGLEVRYTAELGERGRMQAKLLRR